MTNQQIIENLASGEPVSVDGIDPRFIDQLRDKGIVKVIYKDKGSILKVADDVKVCKNSFGEVCFVTGKLAAS